MERYSVVVHRKGIDCKDDYFVLRNTSTNERVIKTKAEIRQELIDEKIFVEDLKLSSNNRLFVPRMSRLFGNYDSDKLLIEIVKQIQFMHNYTYHKFMLHRSFNNTYSEYFNPYTIEINGHKGCLDIIIPDDCSYIDLKLIEWKTEEVMLYKKANIEDLSLVLDSFFKAITNEISKDTSMNKRVIDRQFKQLYTRLCRSVKVKSYKTNIKEDKEGISGILKFKYDTRIPMVNLLEQDKYRVKTHSKNKFRAVLEKEYYLRLTLSYTKPEYKYTLEDENHEVITTKEWNTLINSTTHINNLIENMNNYIQDYEINKLQG